ncbi:hypothetical protein [Flavobacterium sp.]|uniref:hypothetical protein n=1 Tax=Flavobacterium sp. TaxID=239 RepID=UPI00260FF489|nr:hypothetical protein [Flavobacterium sp.]
MKLLKMYFTFIRYLLALNISLAMFFISGRALIATVQWIFYDPECVGKFCAGEVSTTGKVLVVVFWTIIALVVFALGAYCSTRETKIRSNWPWA